MTGEPIRIAMWSGPRNLSTALMRSFGARADTGVIDEPFYGPYLALSGRDHPMREAVMAACPHDWRKAEATILGPAPGGAPIFYQKHMVQHMLPGVGRDWFSRCRHAVLIRDPARALASFADRYADAAVADLGIGETEDILADIEARTGRLPPVVEAEDIRARPEPMLRALCAALDIPFDAAMLAWPPGPRATDGVWAAHWYGAVIASTGFTPPDPAPPRLTGRLADLAETLAPAFRRLQASKLVA